MYVKQLVPRKGGGGGRGRSGGRSGGSKGSPASKKHAPSSFTNSRFSNSFKISGTKSTASPYSDGGGKWFKLNTGRFSGRMSGGGKRQNVYGTRTFGSGYPYGGSGYYLSSRPFPYGFYPIFIQEGYYGDDEYSDSNSTDRPGGNLVAAIVQPSYNTSSVTYRIVGDNSSISAVYAALVANCSVANSSNCIYAFTPSSNSNASMWPLPEQVIQWYRASSFALSLDGYNNTAALASNQPPSNSSTDYTRLPDTPLPDGLNTTFLSCVNYTVGESVPLLDGPTHLSALDIVQIVIWSFQALILIAIISRHFYLKFKAWRMAATGPSTQNSSSEDLLTSRLEDGPLTPTPDGRERS
ncbi:hypothetical protein SCHPADRAFT_946334 [Schizopora paradoxa]|uniref:Uncharacterized protein n=1 Tax=Schizopora paradoxa TaxID=27342 RepID=A0A0H2RMT4_9AGAM|nr:hypothetical protein SCHPADRAFT_946334 [Schizopora paradoxa]